MGRILELRQLKLVDACAGQVAEFKCRFGESVIVTVDLCERVAAVFDFDFAARHFLSASALAEYEKVRASALAEYEKVCASARVEYEKVCAAAFAEAYINDGE